jgi:DNA modification methylase
MPPLPTYIDRYPAKMVASLAEKLVSRYTTTCTKLLDPFCGSAAILAAAQQRGIPVAGLDINPYAVLLSKVKLQGFDIDMARRICSSLTRRANLLKKASPIDWTAKDYWFTARTIQMYERLNLAARELGLRRTRDGRAVLLAYALSIRRCSRADQRSPKPFISKRAIKCRKGRYFDPTREIPALLEKLGKLYGTPKQLVPCVFCADLRSPKTTVKMCGTVSHIMTSPPYINAQDYFRNFKLELHLLEGLLPFFTSELKYRFIGTERGALLRGIRDETLRSHRSLLPKLTEMESTHPWHAEIVHRYLADMARAFDSMKAVLKKNGVLVVVCGDNLVGGYRIATWDLLNALLQRRGFVQFDQFGDDIECRSVPPQRKGHKGLIKREVVSAFLNSK